MDPTLRVEASKKMLEEMDEQVKAIRQDIRAAKDMQKAYADLNRQEQTFKEDDMVSVRIRPKRSSLSLGK